jgi:protein-tyrosine phosphatase
MLVESDEPLRHLRLEGTRNLRDIGGYLTSDGRRTRWRTVLRSDGLHRLPPAAQARLIELGLRTVLDLRNDAESAAALNVFAAATQVRYQRIPILVTPPPDGVEPPPLDAGYRHILDQRQECVRAVFAELLAPGGLPALIHCVAGKDRTGLVAALLLAVARVPRETIAADYALSAACLGDEYLDEGRRWAAGRGWAWERYGHLWGCPPEAILNALDHIDRRYGGVERYLTGLGLTAYQLDTLREEFTEPASGVPS